MIRHRSPSWKIKLGAIFGNLASLVAVSTPAATGVTLLFLGWQSAALVLLVGWLLLVPLFVLLQSIVTPDPVDRIARSLETAVLSAVEDRVSPDPEPHGRSETDPLEALQERYVMGEIDEVEFERRVERFLDSGRESPVNTAKKGEKRTVPTRRS